MSGVDDAAEEREDPVEALIAEFVERRERGETISADAFARAHPDVAEPLGAALRALDAAESLLPTSPLDAPARLGPYRVLGELGSGGMGRVFRAVHDERPHDTLALKLLHLPLEVEERALERFRREGQALARIAHPSIVRVEATGLFDRRPYIAMELVDGTSLSDYVRRARARVERDGTAPWDALELPGEGPPLARIAHLVAAIARAIGAVHREGVLHRDLNLRNVLVRADGRPVVIDFGLVRSDVDPTLTGSGDVVGTPQSMAPEQARGERADTRTDVFGLGCILRELLSLAPVREETNTLALLDSARRRPIVRLRTLSRDVPRELALIADRATAFAPHRRTPSADDVALDLEAWIAGRPVAATAPSWMERAEEAWASHRRALTATGILALVSIAAALGFVLQRANVDFRAEAARRLDAFVVAWLDGDAARSRERWQEFHARDPAYPLGEFMEALSAGDLSRTAAHPAAVALLEGERARRDGRPGDAARSFAIAQDLFPGQPLTTLLQGLADLDSRDFARARPKLESVAVHFGGSRAFHRALASMYAELGALDDAERATRAADAIDR